MLHKLRKYLIAGILVILPLYLSVYILLVIFHFIDGILGRFITVYFEKEFGIYIPGLGIVLFIAIILFIGFLSIHFFGKGLQHFLDRTAGRFPLLRNIYPSIKQTLEIFFSDNALAFKKSVLVEYPSKGIWSVGFITNESFREIRAKTGQDIIYVYIPFAPNPFSGFFVLFARKDVIELEVSVSDAMKLIVSAGILNPEDFKKPDSK